MSILVFGGSGQVGMELRRRASDETMIFADRARADFTRPEDCVAVLAEVQPDAVINAVAYTAVDKAEEEEELATIINGDTPGALAREAAIRGIPFVTISTDYVFDGTGEAPWSVDALTDPLGAYGRSKLAGELAVRAAGGTHAILRTSWVVSAHGKNFLKTMLQLGKEREKLTIVADQVGGPTCAADIAAACVTIVQNLYEDPGKSGTYHFSAAPDVSWAGFAREIFDQAGIDCEVQDIPTSAYPTPAKRPANSRLDNSLTAKTFGIDRPDWRQGITQILSELGDR
ncbi:MAG: dTDP-4-dehydrorhamnose reductase [Pseudomonadota bacterium]